MMLVILVMVLQIVLSLRKNGKGNEVMYFFLRKFLRRNLHPENSWTAIRKAFSPRNATKVDTQKY